MLSELEVVEGAMKAFKKLQVRAEHTGEGVRVLDGDELNPREMKCVHKHDGSWVCTLPHLYLLPSNLIYEFVYAVKDDLRKEEYSCKRIV